MHWRISEFLRPAALLVAALLALAPRVAQARLLFGFLPPEPANQEALSLQADLLARLERTRRYGLLELAMPAGGALSSACGEPAGPDKLARLALSVGGRYEARLLVFDCAMDQDDPVLVEASSASLKNLAGSLRADFLGAYPFLVEIEADGDRLFVAAGPEEKLTPGARLYAYAEQRPRLYRLLRRLDVVRYHEAAFRSELSERYRLPGAGPPGGGELASDRALFELSARQLARPVLGHLVAARRLAGERELTGPGAFEPALEAAGTGQWIAAQGAHRLVAPSPMAAGSGWSFSLEFQPDGGGTLTLSCDGGQGSAIRARLSGSDLVVQSVGGQDGRAGARAHGSLPTGAGGWVLVRLLCYGPWAELYVAGAFAAGIEDFSVEAHGLSLLAEDGPVSLRAPALFALQAVGPQEAQVEIEDGP